MAWKEPAAAGLVTGLLFGGCGSPAPVAREPQEQAAPATAEQGKTAKLVGRVRLASAPPMNPPIRMQADPLCQSQHEEELRSERVLVGTGGELANVLVYLKDYDGPVPKVPEPVLLDQHRCLFTPRVVGLQVGQEVWIRNSDETLHNVHVFANENPTFNVSQAFQGQEIHRTFDHEEVAITVKCDVHPWMVAYLAVLSHPFFDVTAKEGSFAIELPPGSHKLAAWHERYGEQILEVSVGADETIEVLFTFEAS